MTEYNSRIKRAVNAVKKSSKLDAFLVSAETDILYLTGFRCAGARMLIYPSGKPVFFIDTMNSAWAFESLRDLELKEVREGRVQDLVIEEVKDARVKRLGITPFDIFVSENKYLSNGLKNTHFVGGISLVSDLRMIKSETELFQMRKAAKRTVRIWGGIRKNICSGMTELDIARMADTLIREGSSGNSFPTIAAVGENTAFPHSIPTDRKLADGEHVMVDMGIIYNKYCSDLTRTYYNGRINRQIREFKNIIIRSSDLAIKMIKPGISICRVAKAVNATLTGAGFGRYIRHGLGHGVGLDIHERPFVGISSTERFRKGMVVTVEPGLYLPGKGGVREENMVLVTGKGCEVLTV